MSAKRKISPKEFVWYIIAGLLAAWGLTYIVLGLVIDYAPGRPSDFALYQVQQDFIAWAGLSFFNWGLIIFAIGVVLAAIVLCIFASGYDREVEKANRRAQRMINFSNSETEEVVKDAEVK